MCVFPLKMIVISTHGWEVGVALIMLYLQQALKIQKIIDPM